MDRQIHSMFRPTIRSLFLIFVIWKVFIALIAYLSPGIGYDTSSTLLPAEHDDLTEFSDTPSTISESVLKFVRWDAIYFTQISRRGHVFEQEWAFGKGISTILTLTTRAFSSSTHHDSTRYATVGIILSHISHWLSTALIFYISKMLEEPIERASRSAPFVAAILHILSPAGIFLSAPYTESPFAFLTMLGIYLYSRSMHLLARERQGVALVYKLSSGMVFGLATTVRGNGILNGVPFFIDAIETALLLIDPNIDSHGKPGLLLQLQFTIISGCCVALGTIYPQFLAYREYCISRPEQRPWCKTKLPAIFTFVQSYYWDVGFLRYWKISNLPLFLLALPCLFVLITSGVRGILPALSSNATLAQKLRMRLALPQLILALLAITNYHVQIITRLSSAYPWWYLWMAMRLRDWSYSVVMIRLFILYGTIQAVLFASFLPPA